MRYKVNDVDYIFPKDIISVGNLYAAPTTITTSDGLAHTIFSYDFSRPGIYTISGPTSASTADGTDWATFTAGFALNWLANTNGTLSTILPLNTLIHPVLNNSLTSSTWRITYHISGTTFTQTVTGSAGVTVQWSYNPVLYTNLVA